MASYTTFVAPEFIELPVSAAKAITHSQELPKEIA